MNIRYIFLILLFVLCGLGLFSKASRARPWWQVELRITVTGEYDYQTGSKGFNGDYSFTALVLGSMEEDEQDYIFVQAYEKISGMKWNENIYQEKEKKQVNLSGKIKPEVTLNYVFTKDGQLLFDFGIRPVPLPDRDLLLKSPIKRLHLPESAGDDSIADKAHYNNSIVNGSNRVELAIKSLYREKEIKRVFQWKWQEKNRVSFWSHGHEVEATLKILRMKKQKSNREGNR